MTVPMIVDASTLHFEIAKRFQKRIHFDERRVIVAVGFCAGFAFPVSAEEEHDCRTKAAPMISLQTRFE